MSTNFSTLANSILVIAYGRHVVRGFVIQWRTITSGSDTITQALIALGEGEWFGPETIYYAGAVISSGDYTFHPGRQSQRASDPVQGVDTRLGATDLNDGDTYNKMAYISINLPLNVSPNAEPTDFAGIFKTRIVPQFDATGLLTPGKITTVNAVASGGGSLAAGTYYFRIQAESVDGNDRSLPSDEFSITINGTTETKITITWTPADLNHSNFRIYFDTVSDAQIAYFSSSSSPFVMTTVSGATSDSIQKQQGGYSSNPARIIADLLFTLRKLDPSRIDFTSLNTLKLDCDDRIEWDDGSTALSTPATPSCLSVSSANPLTPATYYVKIVGLAGSCITTASAEASVAVGASHALEVIWPPDDKVFKYRVYYGTSPGGENLYVEVAPVPGSGAGVTPSVIIDSTTIGVSDTPPGLTTGTGLALKRYECNRAFVSPTDVSDAIALVLADCGADMQDSNGLLKFYPASRVDARRSSVFSFNNSSILSITPKRADRRTKPNELQITFRDLDDPYLQTFPGYTIQRPLNSGLVSSKISQAVDFGNMNQSQVKRIGEGQMRLARDLDTIVDTLKSTGDAFIVMPGDIVDVTRPELNYDHKLFLVVESRDSAPTETADEREFVLQEWPEDGALYKDTDQIPRQANTYVGGPL